VTITSKKTKIINLSSFLLGEY